MRYFVWKLTFVLTILAFGNLSINAKEKEQQIPAHLKWMGYCDLDPISQKGLVNFARSDNLDMINWASSEGIACFLDVREALCLETFYGSKKGKWSGWDMRADYRQCWKVLKNLISPMVANGSIKGFIIGDEPVWTGLSVAEIKLIADLLKADFPGAPILVIEAAGPFLRGEDCFGNKVDYDSIPVSVDWIGFDNYGPTANKVRKNYEKYLYPKMHPHQKALLIPGAYGSKLNKKQEFHQYDVRCADTADGYIEWAMTDIMISGIMPWHWNNTRTITPNYYWEIGARNMPLTGGKWKDFGAKIAAKNPQPKVKPASLIQNFDNLTDGESLPGTYESNPYVPANMPISKCAFSTKQSFSGTTSIVMKPDSSFRYCWGVNDRNMSDARHNDGFKKQNVEFVVYLTDKLNTNLEILPARGVKYPYSLKINKDILQFKAGEENQYVNIDDNVRLKNHQWNQLRFEVDMGVSEAGDEIISSWINGVKLPDVKFTAKFNITFNTVLFKQDSDVCDIYLDDIGIWGEPEVFIPPARLVNR